MTTTKSDSLSQQVPALEARHVVQTYRRAPVVVTHGRGSWLYDADGREYLDLISGIGVASLGHAHPGLARVVAEQAGILLHTSNLFFHPYQGQLAERLAALSGLERAFFCNSGTEAMEACLKFARRYWYTAGEKHRTGIVALEHAFHGRTIGALSLTAGQQYREPFAPLLDGVSFVAHGDEAALAAAVTDRTAAVVVEAIQGEGGIRPLGASFARAIQDACDRTGALLICDEIQCGLGRTGEPFYFPVLGLRPQLVSIGKALGAGVPIGAALVGESVAARVSFGDHGSTYGGNLLACRAGLFFLEQLTEGGVMAHVRQMHGFVRERLSRLAARQPAIRDVRGRGLMWGLDLDRPAAPVVEAARARHLLVNATAQTVVRLLPPLTISETEMDEAVSRLEGALADVTGAAT
jgi:predicted acetylornithine/succinylornithine family transaminase